MRMRKKPNLVPRMERCAATLITDPEALRGRWLEHFPGHQALQLELGCGKGRFTADTAAQNPDIFLAAIEKAVLELFNSDDEKPTGYEGVG